MTPLTYWQERFNTLIPLIGDINPVLPCWEHTITTTGIDPDRIISSWQAP